MPGIVLDTYVITMKSRALLFGILYTSGGCLVGVEGGKRQYVNKQALKTISE